ncbi:MAG: SUMF1/EgtB/PvdO family nonheme iron enzyme [Candidatus Lernaella stagnicola]|nr:SUMF1/EgtB/PvdO family nonheme iron enzyme [Candidatus Lernaella stagnicola]
MPAWSKKRLAKGLAFGALALAIGVGMLYLASLRIWLSAAATPPAPMASIPATTFAMGYEPPGPLSPHKESRHEVELSAFSIDLHETTVGHYLRCVRAGRCRWRITLLRKPLEAPMGGVTWNDAQDYCRFVGKSLPTEAQWELAARGVDGRDYPWGETWQPEKANACDGENCSGEIDGYAEAAPPGSFPQGAGPYGVLDMAGNMLEWVYDWSSDDYYSQSPRRDPRGPAEGTVKVVRGGSYFPADMGTPDRLKTWRRTTDPPDVRPDHIGFRCAREN